MPFQKFKDFNSKASSSSGGGDGVPDVIVNAPLKDGEVVSKGDVAEIVNGKVRRASAEWNLLGTVKDITSTLKVQTNRVFQLAPNKFLMAYDAQTPQDFGVVLLTRTGAGTFDVGIPFVIGSATGYDNWDFHLEKLSNGKYILFFNGKMGAAILTINLDTGEISLNRMQIGETLLAANPSTMKVFKYSDTKFMAFYGDSGNALKCMIFDVDLLTNTISTTAPVTVVAGGLQGNGGLWGFEYGTNKWVLFSTTYGGLQVWYSVVELTNPATNTISVRSSAALETLGTGNNTLYIQGLRYANNKAILFYTYNTSSLTLRALSITFDPITNVPTVDNVVSSMYMFPTANGNLNQFLVYKVIPVGMNMVALIGRSGVSPYGIRIVVAKLVQSGSYVAPLHMESLDYMYGTPVVNGGDILHFDGEGNHMVFFQDTANNNPKVLEVPIRALNPAGIVLEDRTSGSVSIQMQGVVTGLKGLNPGQTYRVNDSGKLSCNNQTSPQKAGTALTKTTLLIPELFKQNQFYS